MSTSIIDDYHLARLILPLQLKPKFEGAAQELKEEGIALGSVNGDLERELFKKFDITGYPTLFVSTCENIMPCSKLIEYG